MHHPSEETAAEKRKREKQEAKDADSIKRLAAASTLKLDPVKAELAAIIANSRFGDIAQCIRGPVEESFAVVTAYLESCKEALSGELATLMFDQKTLATEVATIKKHMTLAKSLLVTYSRM